MARKKQLLLALLMLVLEAHRALAANGIDGLSSLKRYNDWELPRAKNAERTNGGFMASFIMTAPTFSDPAQGRQINECEVLWTRDFCLLTTKATYEHDPVFRPPRHRGSIDHDKDGDLILWRSAGKTVLFSSERNECHEDSIRWRDFVASIVVVAPWNSEDQKRMGALYPNAAGSASVPFLNQDSGKG